MCILTHTHTRARVYTCMTDAHACVIHTYTHTLYTMFQKFHIKILCSDRVYEKLDNGNYLVFRAVMFPIEGYKV